MYRKRNGHPDGRKDIRSLERQYDSQQILSFTASASESKHGKIGINLLLNKRPDLSGLNIQNPPHKTNVGRGLF